MVFQVGHLPELLVTNDENPAENAPAPVDPPVVLNGQILPVR